MAQAALQFLGTPWHHQGRVKGVGVDCVGLLALCGTEAGATIEDVTDYPRTMAGPWLLDQLGKHCDRLAKAGPYELGDVLVFSFAQGYWHVGIVTQVEPVRIAHAYAPAARCVEQLLPVTWQRRLNSAWRLR